MGCCNIRKSKIKDGLLCGIHFGKTYNNTIITLQRFSRLFSCFVFLFFFCCCLLWLRIFILLCIFAWYFLSDISFPKQHHDSRLGIFMLLLQIWKNKKRGKKTEISRWEGSIASHFNGFKEWLKWDIHNFCCVVLLPSYTVMEFNHEDIKPKNIICTKQTFLRWELFCIFFFGKLLNNHKRLGSVAYCCHARNWRLFYY